MSLHQTYIKNLNFKQHQPLCSKPLQWMEQRKQEARRITQAMNNRPFSFLRLGDMDLTLLLAAQDGFSGEADTTDGVVGGTKPYGNPGIGLRYSARFFQAFQNADYVDFHQLLWINEQLLPQLKLNRADELLCNPTKETSYILPTWIETEFKNYCEYRRVGIAGAEASLLQILFEKPEYRKIAQNYWSPSATVFFHQVRNNGQNLNNNLDLIKEDLRDFVQKNDIDTLFLSLGGGAKILCYELSQELGICAIDFGAMLRMLTYSGSDGNRANRSTHTPFLFRIPFNLYMDCLEQAMPKLEPEVLLAKAHAQIILEVQEKEVGWTHPGQDYDFSYQNLECFQKSFKEYKKRYKFLFKNNQITRQERIDFFHLCGQHGLTFEGRIFYLVFQTKATIKTILIKLRLTPKTKTVL
ncbi:hypothetical protein BJP36_32460 [Moorena producens JHB]|uniref:GT-D fold-like domain-containing protein n=1 Tax=Moorena producens (strain JHB) TaxID=1454205 RepID=A0A1D9G8K4_MOOP1|nr:hypothetical protein [Moorena producens]AOY83938.1 hypothetical protein BJP36_32460 [Moorena producens JHB]